MTERWYWLSKQKETQFYNNINQHDIIDNSPVGTDSFHKRAFPLGIIEKFIACFEDAKTVLDPYSGSGTTRIVCHKAEKDFVGFELDEDYFRQGNERFMKVARQKTIFLMKIKAKYNKKPVYATELAAGMDLEANIEKPIILKPLQRTLVPTGLYLELPKGYEAQVRGRSGLAIREGLVVALGTIDADYRGEINAIVFNLSDKDIIITPNQRICQLIVCKYEKIELTLGELNETKRGANGFGSTGV